MKLSELKQRIESDAITKEFLESEISRYYIPFLEKKVIVEQIIDACTYVTDGIVRVDLFDKQFFTDIKILFAYYNIENDLDINELTEIYDLLVKSDWITAFEFLIKKDVALLRQMIDNSLDEYVKSNNSLEGIIAKAINKLIDKLPDEKSMNKIIKDLPKQINKIDPEKLKYISEAIGWNNGIKKSE